MCISEGSTRTETNGINAQDITRFFMTGYLTDRVIENAALTKQK